MSDLVAQARPAARAADSATYPLTFSQAFLADVGDDGSGCADGHVVGTTVRIDGEIEHHLLQQALDVVVERHTSLRSRIVRDGPLTRMVIDPPTRVPLLVEEAPHDDEAAQARALEMQEDTEARGISLDERPLVRATLLHGESRSWVSIVLHHVAGDAHALAVVVRDVFAAYVGVLDEARGESYTEFALRQHAIATTDGWAEDVRWWQQHLAGATLVTAPRRSDEPLEPALGSEYVARVFHLDASLTEEVMNLCLEMGATPFSVLLTAFVHTARLHMSDDATSFMTISAGREPVTRDTVGTFFNHVPVHVPVTEAVEPVNLVRTVHHAWEVTQAHEIPFQLLVEHAVEGIDFTRDPDRVPVTFEWLPPAPTRHGASVWHQIPSIPGETPSAALPLGALWLMRLNDRDAFEGIIRYNPRDVSAQTVDAWTDEFREFLDRLCRP